MTSASQESCPRGSDIEIGIFTNVSSSTDRQASGRTFTGSGNGWGIGHCLVGFKKLKFIVCGSCKRENGQEKCLGVRTELGCD